MLLDAVAERMAALVPEGTEVLAGLEMGGIAIVTALGRHTGLPCAFVRFFPFGGVGKPKSAEGRGRAVVKRRVCIRGMSRWCRGKRERWARQETMAVSGMNHFTILTDDVPGTVEFYGRLLGLRDGPRPDLGFPGAWM